MIILGSYRAYRIYRIFAHVFLPTPSPVVPVPSRAAACPSPSWSLGSTAISSAAAPEGQLRARRSTSATPAQQLDHRAQGSPS